jgi:hypothetical protein
VTDPSRHESRSQVLSDEIRRFLVAAHTGGIATIVAFAASLIEKNVRPGWVVLPISLFLFGIFLAAVSMFLAQYREIRRRDAAEAGSATPQFNAFMWSSSWNWASLAAFLIAAGLTLNSLARMQL